MLPLLRGVPRSSRTRDDRARPEGAAGVDFATMRTAFVRRETFRWSDADLQQVVNNAVYLTLFEQARFGYFKQLGVLDGDAFPFLLGSIPR